MLKISCIIPLYNDEKYICRCINSILEQSYDNYEIIIINDGSTDSSLELCKEMKKKNNRIKIYTKINGGVCSSRNLGVSKATGDYCLFIDSDDVFNDKNMFSDLVNMVKKYDSPELITFDYKRFYFDGSEYDEFSNDGSVTVYNNTEGSTEYLKGNRNFSMVLWRRCYRADIFKQIKFDDNMLPEDLATAFNIYTMSHKIVHVSKSYYSYFIKESGLTIQKKQKDFINLFEITTNLYNQQLLFYRDNEIMKNVCGTIYCNYLLTIYSKFYNSEKNSVRSEYLNLLKFKIDDVFSFKFELKTCLAYLVFKVNKKIFSNIMCKRDDKNVKNR